MTVTYSAQVATTKYWTFFRLLLRWRGSIYKLIWFELLLFTVLYSGLSLTYRLILKGDTKRWFEHLCIYCDKFSNLIPVAFVLGFYVSMVVSRWWDQFIALPWPDNAAIFLTAFLHGNHERAVIMRRTVIRYVNLGLAMCFRSISSPAKKQFPTEEHFVTAGLMTADELRAMNAIDMTYNKYYVPLVWAASVVARARREGFIRQDRHLDILVEEIANFRGALGYLFCFDWINPPLVYTQVATIAVYTYFIAGLFARQFLDPAMKYKNYEVDFYVPVFGILQFVFYMGWLKVAESLINPFGEDDDDFDINYLIERNLQISYLIVDEMHHEHPELVKDAYWDTIDLQLPYQNDATAPKEKESNFFAGSIANIAMMEHPHPQMTSNAASLASVRSDQDVESQKSEHDHEPSSNIEASMRSPRRMSSRRRSRPKSGGNSEDQRDSDNQHFFHEDVSKSVIVEESESTNQDSTA